MESLEDMAKSAMCGSAPTASSCAVPLGIPHDFPTLKQPLAVTALELVGETADEGDMDAAIGCAP